MINLDFKPELKFTNSLEIKERVRNVTYFVKGDVILGAKTI